jgi:hypothetical protein
MKCTIAIGLSAATVTAGAILHYLATPRGIGLGAPRTGTELMVTGVIALALSNVALLVSRNRQTLIDGDDHCPTPATRETVVPTGHERR